MYGLKNNDTSDYIEEQTTEVAEETEITDELEDVQNDTEVSVANEETGVTNETVTEESDEIPAADDENVAEEGTVTETDTVEKAKEAYEATEEVNVALANVEILAYQDDEGNIYIEADNPEFLREIASEDYYGENTIFFHHEELNSVLFCNYEKSRSYVLVDDSQSTYILIPWYSAQNHYLKQDETYSIEFEGSVENKYNYSSFDITINIGAKPYPEDVDIYQNEDGDLVIQTSDTDYLQALALPYYSIDRMEYFIGSSYIYMLSRTLI